MKTYTIKAKQNNSIHDISDNIDRDIKFAKGCKYAVVLASYYGGKGYTTHKTLDNALDKAKSLSGYSKTIIDTDGNEYDTDNGYELN